MDTEILAAKIKHLQTSIIALCVCCAFILIVVVALFARIEVMNGELQSLRHPAAPEQTRGYDA
jgi:hypothetical protein